jgi:protein-disulfide isomerase
MLTRSLALSFGVLLFVFSIFSISSVNSAKGQTNTWKEFSSDVLEVSLEIPNNWEVNEKTNRFDEGPDFIANNGLNSFSITKPIPNAPSYESNLETIVSFWNPGEELEGDITKIRIIEGFAYNKHNIDGLDTASALYVFDVRLVGKVVDQIILVQTDDGIYKLSYRDSPEKFDGVESQSILNHILDSVSFGEKSSVQNIHQLIYNLTTPITSNVNHLGNDDAEIQIIEFADYQDPFSARFNQETKANLVSKYVDSGIVRFGFKDLVIHDLPQDKISTLGAEASYCAADQDKYWEYHDEIYRNSRGENTGWISQDSLIGFAKNVNITNISEFTSCLDSHKYNPVVVDNDMFSKNLGLASTPTFLILKDNSTKIAAIEGAQPFEVFEDVINQVLNEEI